MQTLLRRSSMATAEDVQQIPGVTGPLRKRSRTDQPSISTPVWYQRHFALRWGGVWGVSRPSSSTTAVTVQTCLGTWLRDADDDG
ncbi:hypothetical protein HaLaN_32164 [Haematococcus lacustris]|uniref:Uncharacterized protein n=1 Tax=Haematococcus lacustris TaxID=44745 RepID=A0A6A0AK53_HAELA|nr:hypothetical protein HaLaN_32164 [Haematococcus lacustris]